MKKAKEFLKTELDKIDKNAFWEIDGYGNVDDVVKVMEEYANQSKYLPSDKEIEKHAKIVRDKTLHGNVPITEEQLQLSELAYINGAKWMRDNYLNK